jgi:ribosome-associated translation inhibitor RaiA
LQIQVNTDNQIESRDSLTKLVETGIESQLGRFSDMITRVEVHLSDVNGDKEGDNDKRCLIEARLRGQQPAAASHSAGSLEQAVDGATRKLRRVLSSTLGRLSNTKGRTSIKTELNDMAENETPGGGMPQ